MTGALPSPISMRRLSRGGIVALCIGCCAGVMASESAEQDPAAIPPDPPVAASDAESGKKGQGESTGRQEGSGEDDAEPAESRLRYLIGAVAVYGPTYAGSQRKETKYWPVIAIRYGRFRFAPSRASALAGPDDGSSAPGASAVLGKGSKWQMGVALRMDSGREESDDPALIGMPDIEPTLRGRVFARYAVAEKVTLGTNVNFDLLGRQGGILASVDLARSMRFSSLWQGKAGIGIGLADASYMRLYYGVPENAVIPGARPAYNPGGGLRDIHAGFGASAAIAPRWRVMFALTANRLLGDAAASPLVSQRQNFNAVAGFAYVN